VAINSTTKDTDEKMFNKYIYDIHNILEYIDSQDEQDCYSPQHRPLKVL